MNHCLGSHVSVAGGLHLGVRRAVEVGCQCLQVFTKNANAWRAKPLDDAAVASWRAALAESGLRHPIAHASYLINLATPDDGLFEKSVDALVVEWQRCESLGIEGLVLHPGAYTTSDEATGLTKVATAIAMSGERVSPRVCRLLLENTAGQGTTLGYDLRQLGQIIAAVDSSSPSTAAQIGVCLDTCHAFAAGYAINTAAGWRDFSQQVVDHLPADSVRALHLNDSKKPLGSRVDRHEHIGRGQIGPDGFRLLLADPFFGPLPGYLETEKGTDPETGLAWDLINLKTLRSLADEV